MVDNSFSRARGATQSPQESAQVRAREVLQREIEAEGADFARAHSVRREATAGFTLRLEGVAIRAMLAFAHQSPSRAAGEDEDVVDRYREALIDCMEKLDRVRPRFTDHLSWVCKAAIDNALAVLNGAQGPKATPQTVPANAELPGREDLPTRFEAWWSSYPHNGRVLANYGQKKQIAFDAFEAAALAKPTPPEVAGGSVGEDTRPGILDLPRRLMGVAKAMRDADFDEDHECAVLVETAAARLAKPTPPASVSGEVVRSVEFGNLRDLVKAMKPIVPGTFAYGALIDLIEVLAAAPEAATPSAVDRETEERAVAALHPPASVGYLGIVSSKPFGPAFWMTQAFHLGGNTKTKLCSIAAHPTKEDAERQVAKWLADNASIDKGVCPSTGKPLTPDMLGITCSKRFDIAMFSVGAPAPQPTGAAMTNPEAVEALVMRLGELLAKATPGPWRVVPYGDGDSLVIHDARGDWRVCFMATPGKTGDFEGIEANASLITTAVNALPTLLAALSSAPVAAEGWKPIPATPSGEGSK